MNEELIKKEIICEETILMNLFELNIDQLEEKKITKCIITKESKERLVNRYKLLEVLNDSKEKYFIVLEKQHKTEPMQNIEVVIFPFSVAIGSNQDLLQVWHPLSDEEKLTLERSTEEGLAREMQPLLDEIIEDLLKKTKNKQIVLILIGERNVSFCSNHEMIEWERDKKEIINNLETKGFIGTGGHPKACGGPINKPIEKLITSAIAQLKEAESKQQPGTGGNEFKAEPVADKDVNR